jgi:hypothetical protein
VAQNEPALIVRLPEYERALKRLRAAEADVEAIERAIAENPAIGDVIPGLSGLRKVRFGMAGRGKRGGGRAIYYAVMRRGRAYSKADREDLTEREKRLFRQFVEELEKADDDEG